MSLLKNLVTVTREGDTIVAAFAGRLVFNIRIERISR